MVVEEKCRFNMSSCLNEITALRLEEFRRRRLQLNLSRGWATVVTVFVVTLFVAIAVDAFSTYTIVRWIASGMVYLGTFSAWLWCCWRPSRMREPLESEAKRFEEADPRLREQLLSAVELSGTESDEINDSIAFKELLQSKVGELIAPVDVSQLLPWQMVRRWLLVAAGSLALVLMLGFIPQLHWGNRVARALLPSANLDRVSSIAITIEQPLPNSKAIASGDLVGVIARIVGPFPKSVLLESRTADGTLHHLPMQPLVDSGEQAAQDALQRVQATISTEQSWIDYRVTADDAATAWYRLTTQPRPEVLKFNQTLTPPSYAQIGTVELTVDHGNVRALVGTQVKLAMELNQEVSMAELRWQASAGEREQGQTSKALILNKDNESGRYIAEFAVERSLSYRIYLQSAETGFVNEFSPSYTVEAISDQPPEIVWTRPTSPKQIVAPDQIVTLGAQIDDEMPVDGIKQWTRINRDGEWRPYEIASNSLVPFKVDPFASLSGNRASTSANWQVDLLQLSTKVGDTIEMKLTVSDRMNQSAESEVVEFLISESSITLTPKSSEQLRMEVATQLEAFSQRIQQTEQEIQELVKPKTPPANDVSAETQSLRLVELVRTLRGSVESEVPKLIKLIEQAASQTEDNAGLLELEQAGQTLSMLKIRNASELVMVVQEITDPPVELTPKRRNELEKVLVQQSHRVQEVSQIAATSFRAMVSQDVGRRVSEQVAKLKLLFANFADSPVADDPSGNHEQQRRTMTVMSRQLLELQQSMLDAMPGVRPDTKLRLRQTADSITNLVGQIDNMNPKAEFSEMKKQAEMVERTLAQMSNAAWFDNGLHDAIMNGHRRFSELGGQPGDQFRRAIANLTPPDNVSWEIKAAKTEDVLENLGDRRSLVRARKEGDRDYASDLGNVARAIRAVTENASLTKADQQRTLGETAGALDTLQAAHGVKEAMVILDDLLRGERWSLNSSEALVNHPLLYDSFGERLENAVKLLRQAKIPNELVDLFERIRWHEANGKAGQKINSRRWENNPPVSAAAELSQLSEQLAAANTQLEPMIQQARAKIAEQAPSLGELAKKAATAARELQQQTQSLAQAVDRKEVPDESAQLEQLQSEQIQSQQPVMELRDALVDHADSQDLLKQQELVNAREADAALAVVDAAKEQIETSLQSALAPAESTERAKALENAADQQASAADKLDQLAQHFEAPPEKSPEPTVPAGAENPLMQLANELGASDEAQKRYNEAAQLARLAAAKPEEVLRQLEQKLAKSPSMQQEMSRISQELAEQALNRLDRAANQQQRMQPALEASDPRFQAQKKILMQDLNSARESINQLLGLLVSEAKWTSGAGKEEKSQKQIEAVENQLRGALVAIEKTNAERTFDEILDATQSLAESLNTASDALDNAAKSLNEASDREVHQNDADLANRRREMQDRQRRIAQQDVRNVQQSERQQQQSLRQAENELKQVEQREKSLQQHLTNIQKEVEKHPDNQNLKQQLVEAQRNLGYGQAQKQAAELTKQQMMNRVEQAVQMRDAVTKKQQPDLKSVNPSSQLASELSRSAAERSAQLAKQLAPWQENNELKAEANIAQLQNSSQDERAVHQSVQDSADDLSRASRHEQRLKSQPASQQLAAQSAAIEQLNANENQLRRAGPCPGN